MIAAAPGTACKGPILTVALRRVVLGGGRERDHRPSNAGTGVGWLRVNARRRPDGGVVVALTGELDLAEVGRVSRRMAKLEQDSPAELYMDLRKLTFLDSSGLQALVDAEARGRA